MYDKLFPNMTEILTPPPDDFGEAYLDKFHIEGFAAWRNHITPGDYVRLVVNGQLMMSNTDMEKWRVHECLKVLANAPAADVVEVVRCKDCIYSKKYNYLEPEGRCMCERKIVRRGIY